MLALAVAGQAVATFLVSTPAFLIPQLHLEQGVPLGLAGLLSAAPTVGMVATLVLWGALADRRGERSVIAGGLALTAVFAAATALAADVFGLLVAMLVLGGAASAATNSASGRVVIGWFPRERRGLAMGIRQMCQPLGVALAAAVVPSLAELHGIAAPFWLAAALTGILAIACFLGIRNPPRPPARPLADTVTGAVRDARAANPYRGQWFLQRIHAVSVLLVVPQFALSTFGLVWLITDLGYSAGAAGAVVAVSQLVGAFGRIGIGALSDRVGSRVRVLRLVAVAVVGLLLATALVGELHWAVAGAIVFVIATTASVADNGLAFTSVAEAAGHAWSGKALGIQNTGQFVAASAVGPLVGVLITAVGYPLAFALLAIAPAAALPLVPGHDEHRD
ncbi:MFS transporter [Agromyces sp. MMS17-SY077]|uniref:MFS transporter n=2 Tax=Agromyces seonyuensis TaxID=2662446 RepID=A0A6I4NSA2_9MICO|nr:MFS transporter [Agromyces seonyuensis]